MSKRILRIDVILSAEGFEVEATDYDGNTVLIERDCAYPDAAAVAPAVHEAVNDLVRLVVEKKAA